jgi:hypothetical protein
MTCERQAGLELAVLIGRRQHRFGAGMIESIVGHAGAADDDADVGMPITPTGVGHDASVRVSQRRHCHCYHLTDGGEGLSISSVAALPAFRRANEICPNQETAVARLHQADRPHAPLKINARSRASGCNLFQCAYCCELFAKMCDGKRQSCVRWAAFANAQEQWTMAEVKIRLKTIN